MTIFAKPLRPGGTIGVAAPASPYDARSEILRGVEWWESRGYRVKLADGVFERDDYVAGDARSRAADLAALFDDPEVDVVQCLQGGYGSAQTIPHLDFDQIAATFGYSCRRWAPRGTSPWSVRSSSTRTSRRRRTTSTVS